MLSDHRDQIDTLLLKRLSGDLSSSETAVLEQMMAQDADVKTLWLTLQRRINTPDAQDFKRSLDADRDWMHLTHIINKREKRIKILSVKFGLLVIMIIAGIVCSSALLIQNHYHKPPASKPAHRPAPAFKQQDKK